ncbi:MAG: flagellar basal body rod protein FlgB [Myxococcales bacterium]|nr:flagellar basal body rod protein FlgB [Myxococcales bacterium]
MRLFDTTLTQVERSLDVRLSRQGVLAGNVANADTPGFKPKDVDFLAAMSQVMRESQSLTRTNPLHVDASGQLGADAAPVDSYVKEVSGGTPSFDGNEVDLDTTMSSMAENAIQYGANARAATAKLAILKYVVSEGS